MAYALLASPRGQREIDALPLAIAAGLKDALRAIAAGPKGHRFDVRPVKGPQRKPPLLRLRVGGFRVLLFVDHARKEIVVVGAGPRETVYRGLDGLE